MLADFMERGIILHGPSSGLQPSFRCSLFRFFLLSQSSPWD